MFQIWNFFTMFHRHVGIKFLQFENTILDLLAFNIHHVEMFLCSTLICVIFDYVEFLEATKDKIFSNFKSKNFEPNKNNFALSLFPDSFNAHGSNIPTPTILHNFFPCLLIVFVFVVVVRDIILFENNLWCFFVLVFFLGEDGDADFLGRLLDLRLWQSLQ